MAGLHHTSEGRSKKMSEIETAILPNGLRVVHCRQGGNVSYCGVAVNAGTRDERPDENGLAHLVEHTIFKGTARRKACHIRTRMESVGGELNAYTTKEETVLYSIYPSAYHERAMELLGDLVAHATFPDEEFEKEREVVREEIDMYRDTPSELVYDEFEIRLFAGHPLGRNILGTADELSAMSPMQARAFMARCYKAGEMVFFSYANAPMSKVVEWAQRYFGDLSCGMRGESRQGPAAMVPFDERIPYDTHQAHVVWGCRAYDLYDERRLALLLLNNMIGGPGQNSLLNVALREQRGYVYAVESSVVNYTDTGLFTVYFGTDGKYVGRCLRRIAGEMERLRHGGLTPWRVAAAKKQYRGQLLVAEDNNESLALALGKSYMRYGSVLSQEEQAQRIEAVTVEQMQAVADDIMDTRQWSLLVLE